MRKLLLAIMTTILLSGCDLGFINNHGYGYHFDYVTKEGIAIRWATKTYIEPDTIDAAFLEVVECLDVTDAGDRPLVIFTDARIPNHPMPNSTVQGYTYFDTGTIIIYFDTENYIRPSWKVWIAKHEYIHFIASTYGLLSDFNNSNHIGAAFNCD